VKNRLATIRFRACHPLFLWCITVWFCDLGAYRARSDISPFGSSLFIHDLFFFCLRYGVFLLVSMCDSLPVLSL